MMSREDAGGKWCSILAAKIRCHGHPNKWESKKVYGSGSDHKENIRADQQEDTLINR